MWELFPCIPILGVFIFYCFNKKGITRWGFRFLPCFLSWVAALISSYAIFLWSFEILLIFRNFLRPEVLSRFPTCEATRICQLISANHASPHLCWKENLLSYQKVSKYYGYDCRFKLPELSQNYEFFVKLLTALMTNLYVQSSITKREISPESFTLKFHQGNLTYYLDIL